MAFISSYYIKQNPIAPMHAEVLVEEVLLYVFNIEFPATLLS